MSMHIAIKVDVDVDVAKVIMALISLITFLDFISKP